MSFNTEQLLNAHKANLETFFGLSSKAFEGVEKVVELNLAASRAALTEAASHSQQLLAVKDLQQFIALQTQFFQPLAEKTASYNRHLLTIANSTATALSQSVEAKAAEFQQGFSQLVEATAKNAPAGSETAVAMMKSAASAASNAVESVQKAVKQASDMAEANFKAMSSAVPGQPA